MTKENILNRIPNHTEELKNTLSLTKKSYDRYINDMTLGHVTPRKRKTYKYIFETYLYAVADLSLEVNAIQDDLEKHYKKTYKDTSPALGNKLFFEEYFSLHKEYDKVKRFIWKAIFKIDGKENIQPDILI